MLQGGVWFGELAGDLAEKHAGGAPLVAAGLGVFGGRGQQRRLAGQAAPELPPLGLGQREPQRQGVVMLHGPGERVAHAGFLGVEKPQAGRLLGARVQPGGGRLGQLGHVPRQGGPGFCVLAGLGQQPGPEGAESLEHRVTGPAVGIGSRRDQQ